MYARVSSSDQKGDLHGQVASVVAPSQQARSPCRKDGDRDWLRPERAQAQAHFLAEGPRCQRDSRGARDRLMRFGSEYVEAAFATSGKRLMVVEPTEVTTTL